MSRGGTANPWLSERIKTLKLTPEVVDDLVAMMESLHGEGYQDIPPNALPQ